MSDTTDELDTIIDQMTIDINATGHTVRSIALSRKMDTGSGRYWQVTVFFETSVEHINANSETLGAAVFFETSVEHINANSETLGAAVADAVSIAQKWKTPRVQLLRDLRDKLIEAKKARLPEPLVLPASRLERALREELGE
jgi:hypothetical protein